jgi:hypothetical protein
VPVQLPFERLPALGEDAHLTGDQLVEVGTLEPGELAVQDPAATRHVVPAEERSVTLEGNAGR